MAAIRGSYRRHAAVGLIAPWIAGLAIGSVVSAALSSRASPIIEVRAEDGRFVTADGVTVGYVHVGRHLRIMNVAEVAGMTVALSSVGEIDIPGGRKQAVYQLDELPQDGGADAASICTGNADGTHWLIPVAGRWADHGVLRRDRTGATLACSSGALGKCMRWGLAPWIDPDAFTACTRMTRADYCGDGHPHTRPGVLIAFDLLKHGDTPTSSPDGERFEALWRADGAHCVATTRVPELFGIADLLNQCPERAAPDGDLGACQAQVRALFDSSATIEQRLTVPSN